MPVLWCPANCSLGKNAIFERKSNKKRAHSLNKSQTAAFFSLTFLLLLFGGLLCVQCCNMHNTPVNVLNAGHWVWKGRKMLEFHRFMAVLCRVHVNVFYSFGFYFTFIFGHCGDNTIMNAMIYGGSRLKNVPTKLRARYDSLNLIFSRATFWNTVTLDDNDGDNDKIQWQIILLRAKEMIASVNIVLCSLSCSTNH